MVAPWLLVLVSASVRWIETGGPLAVTVVPVSNVDEQLEVELFLRSDVMLSIEWFVGLWFSVDLSLELEL